MEILRPELPSDADAIERVHREAFPTPAEARLVVRLRAQGLAVISLVAECAGEIVGHVLFSPVTIGDPPAQSAATALYLGLAPVAVRPAWQRRGIGGRLIRAGLAACRDRGAALVVVLGEPRYYARFGFEPAEPRGLTSEYDAGEAFRVVDFLPAPRPAVAGLVRYAGPFRELESHAGE